MTQENSTRLLTKINQSLRLLDAYHNIELESHDSTALSKSIDAALVEEVRVQPDHLEELWQVKPLHDRIHTIVIMLRVARNNLERMEQEAESALQNARELSRAVEQPEDHEL
jgi:AICAR transformylase/IMP cyclohydrolase PurH